MILKKKASLRAATRPAKGKTIPNDMNFQKYWNGLRDYKRQNRLKTL